MSPVDAPPSRPVSPWIVAPVSGAVAAALVIGVGWMLGWPAIQPASAPPAPQLSAAIDGLTARVAGLEPKVGKPVSDPAAAARTEALEKTVAALRTELAATRAQGDKLASAVNEVKSAPRGDGTASPDLSGIDERIAKIESQMRTQSAEIAQQGNKLADAKADAKPADDMPLRRLVSAALLDVRVRIGEPYPAALAATKALAPNPDVLKPLDQFAEKGVPNANRLSTELLALVPKLQPAAQQNNATTTGTGIVERLQAGAAKLVKIERTDTAGTDRGAVVARITAAALRNDFNEARRELKTLEPDRSRRGAGLARTGRRARRRAGRIPSIRGRRHGCARQTGELRISMIRIILFLLLIALGAAGAAWIAEQTGDVVLSWGSVKLTTKLPVFVLGLGIVIVAAMMLWAILRGVWRMPARMRKSRRERRQARGRHAITQGLLAIGHGDSTAARIHAEAARKHAAHDPLALLLHAQSAQLDGDREGAQRAFRAMAEREDTRLLGLRGLFIEAQRADDPVAAVMVAEEALRMSPSSSWASHAVLGFCCAKGDWAGALKILDNNQSAGLIDKATYRRQRGVLLTARALELEKVDRDLARESVMEAVKLAPTLVPAAVLASKFESEAHQTRRSMRLVETAWLAQPHPDLADAYSHVKLGDSARQRLVRVETLAAKMPGHIEGALAIARAAIDASEFAKAREALAPFIAAPTQRVALLMAEIERTEHGDSGRARAWTLRAVRALHDPAWTADGYVSDRWRPVSPVTGRLDAFQWQTPVAALPSDKGGAIESSPSRKPCWRPRAAPSCSSRQRT